MTEEEIIAFNNLAERVLTIEKSINDHVMGFTANFAALIEILDLSTDQRLDCLSALVQAMDFSPRL